MNTLQDEVTSLPCFAFNNHDLPINIERIEQGQSSICFKVSINDKSYFVKYLKENAGVNAELIASSIAAKHGLAPTVIYSNKRWMVTAFIQGKPLDCVKLSRGKLSVDTSAELNATLTSQLSIDDKINLSLKLMAQCHELEIELPIFNIVSAICELIQVSSYNSSQQKCLNEALLSIQTQPTSSLVFCHGDLNFSNVLLGNKPWLLDYECACLAEREFDVAMFIAINLLNSKQQDKTIKSYKNKSNTELNKFKINSYLAYSYLLNGLWYLEKFNTMFNDECSIDFKDNTALFKKLGLEQLSSFDQISRLTFKLEELMR